IVEEGELELAGLQHAGDVGVVVGRGEIAARFGVAPGAGEVGAVLRLHEADQDNVAHAGLLAVTLSPCLKRLLERGLTTAAACRGAAPGLPARRPRRGRPWSRAHRGP